MQIREHSSKDFDEFETTCSTFLEEINKSKIIAHDSSMQLITRNRKLYRVNQKQELDKMKAEKLVKIFREEKKR